MSRRSVIGLISIAVVGLGLGCFSGYQQYTSWKNEPTPDVKPIPNPIEGDGCNLMAVAAPNKNTVDGISLPEPMDVTTNQKLIAVIAKTDGDVVRWIVRGQYQDDQPAVNEIPKLKMLLINPVANRNDMIVITAYTSIGGIPTQAAITFIRVRTSGPSPPIPPTPPIPPSIDDNPVHVTFVLDYAKPTPETSKIRNDVIFRKKLTDWGIDYHEVSILSEDLKKPGGLWPAVEKHGGAPVVVIQDKDGDIIWSGKFVDLTKVIEKLGNLLKEN